MAAGAVRAPLGGAADDAAVAAVRGMGRCSNQGFTPPNNKNKVKFSDERDFLDFRGATPHAVPSWYNSRVKILGGRIAGSSLAGHRVQKTHFGVRAPSENFEDSQQNFDRTRAKPDFNTKILMREIFVGF